jgi:hypothetical protein
MPKSPGDRWETFDQIMTNPIRVLAAQRLRRTSKIDQTSARSSPKITLRANVPAAKVEGAERDKAYRNPTKSEYFNRAPKLGRRPTA